MSNLGLFEYYFHSYTLEKQKSNKSAKGYICDSEELEDIFRLAKQTLESALAEKDFKKCCDAIKLFQKAAYLPRARTYFVEEILNKTAQPLLQDPRYSQEMKADPKTFVERCFISEYHFYRHFTKLAHQNKNTTEDLSSTVIPFPRVSGRSSG